MTIKKELSKERIKEILQTWNETYRNIFPLGLYMDDLAAYISKGLLENIENFSELDSMACKIYNAYPKERRVSKGNTLKSINKQLTCCDPNELLEITKKYAEVTKDMDPQFIPMSATWFNQQRFKDDPCTWNPNYILAEELNVEPDEYKDGKAFYINRIIPDGAPESSETITKEEWVELSNSLKGEQHDDCLITEQCYVA